MGIPWDGMGWDRHNLLWDGMGWDRKICPMDKPAYCTTTLTNNAKNIYMYIVKKTLVYCH